MFDPLAVGLGARPGNPYFLGIDLGTTNSCAVVFDARDVQNEDRGFFNVVVEQPEDFGQPTFDHLVPSFLARRQDGRYIVGAGAKRLRKRTLTLGRDIFYSTKRFMGIGRDPFWVAAPKEYNAPWKVAAEILRTIKNAAEREFGPEVSEQVVITVPASFQVAARQDTLRAARAAGFNLQERLLFDEPNAALLATLHKDPEGPIAGLRTPSNVLVIDFGGGTCDVSILRLTPCGGNGVVNISNLALSRYTELGGDDIDGAIARNILLRQCLQSERLEEASLSLSVKKHLIDNYFLAAAEPLKIKASEYRRRFGAGSISFPVQSLGGLRAEFWERDRPVSKEINLLNATMSISEFDSIVAGYLDPVDLEVHEDGSVRVISIFSPVSQCLSQAALSPHSVGFVLLTGGSVLLPGLSEAVSEYFPNATVLAPQCEGDAFLSIARGAALQSCIIHSGRRQLIQPITPEPIGILTQEEKETVLLGAGTRLPARGNTASKGQKLVVPRDGMAELEIVVVGHSATKVLGKSRIGLPPGTRKGSPVACSWTIDENKVFQLHAAVAGTDCRVEVENPLCSMSVPTKLDLEILETEQAIASLYSDSATPSEMEAKVAHLCYLLHRVGRAEKGLDWARYLRKVHGRETATQFRWMAMHSWKLSRLEDADRQFRRSLDLGDNPLVRYSYSRFLYESDRMAEALEQINAAIDNGNDASHLAQKAEILDRLGRRPQATALRRKALEGYRSVRVPSDYDRYWMGRLASLLGDAEMATRAESQEQGSYNPENLPAEVLA